MSRLPNKSYKCGNSWINDYAEFEWFTPVSK